MDHNGVSIRRSSRGLCTLGNTPTGGQGGEVVLGRSGGRDSSNTHKFTIHLQVSSTVPPILSVPGKKTYSKLLNKGHVTIRMALTDPDKL